MSIIDSGMYGDVYRINKTQITKVIYTKRCTSNEVENLQRFQGMYGIPRLYDYTFHKFKRFFGKHGNGIYSNEHQSYIKRGPACSIIMEYAGELTLDNYTDFTMNQLHKVMFNTIYILYTLYATYSMLHGDMHRRNVVLKRVNPYSKTYYINGLKYRLNNQVYKVTLIDFDNCKQPDVEMSDVNYLCSFFDGLYQTKETFDDFFEVNFNCFKVS